MKLITKVWKEPSLFVLHPRTIAAFSREMYGARCAAA